MKGRRRSGVARWLPGVLAAWMAAWRLAAADLVGAETAWRYFKGEAHPSTADRAAWRQADFGDSGWNTGLAPFHYGEGLTGGTLLNDMQGRYTTVFLRSDFEVPDPGAVTDLRLTVRIDDGFVAWLNGVEITRVNVAEGEPSHTDRALTSVPEPVLPVVHSVPPAAAAALRPGRNVLAVQIFNGTPFSSDILFAASLSGVVRESVPPVVLAVDPPPGEITNLTRITVTFSEPVTGVDAGDLLLNGTSALAVTGVGARHEFQFAPPPYGRVVASWNPGHGITDQAATPNRFVETAPGSVWAYDLIDGNVPFVVERFPPDGAEVSALEAVEVRFSEPVTGVDAADLLVNGMPAIGVEGTANGPYRFQLPPLETGPLRLEFAPGHGIEDEGLRPQAFAGSTWSLVLDPLRPIPSLRINEILPANAEGIVDEDGDRSGWIEIANVGARAVDLTGFSLSDDPEEPGRWVFPSMEIPAGGLLVVFTSGKDRRTPAIGSRLHTNFRLARRGEFLGLFDDELPRRPIDSVAAGEVEGRNDISYGTDGAGMRRYFMSPSPGATNGGATAAGACEAVRFSVPRGYPVSAFDLVLTCATPGAVIRYTTDGSEPSSTNGIVYSAPFPIQRPTPVRAAAFRADLLPSVAVTHTYIVSPSAAIRTVPAIALATAPSNLTGPNGIVGMQGGTRDGGGAWQPVRAGDYYNPNNRGIAWERPVSVELLRPEDNGGFQIDAGLRLHASDYFRPRLTPGSKFSWRTYFRGDYGAGRLRFPLVPDSPVGEFDALVLRAGSNDLNPFVKDELVRRLFADCGQVSARGLLVALFLNGRYTGYYNPVERIEKDFLQLHHGGGDAWDVVSQGGAIDGDTRDFDALVRQATASDPVDPAAYALLGQRLDLVNFVDYLLVNAYGYNGDWPHNNWRAGRERREDALWRFYVWDAEWSFGTYGREVSGNTFEDLTGGSPIATLYQRLRRNPEFRLLFADRAHRHLFNQGALSPENVTRRFGELYETGFRIISGMDRSITGSWVRIRPAHLQGHLRQEGLFRSDNAPVLRRHGGTVPPDFSLTMTNRSGVIWYTLDGTDPRVPGTGGVSAGARRYNPASPPRLAAAGTLRARSLDGSEWSALTEADFRVGFPTLPVRITEIQYNPAGGSAYEFVEIHNASSAPIDLGGVRFEGVELAFPNGTRMPAGATWILASGADPAAFSARYPGRIPAARFDGALSNAGERLALVDADGTTIESVDFRDDAGWPAAADGDGASLERVDLDGDPDDPATWRASIRTGGSPGTFIPPDPVADGVRIDEILALNRTAVPGDGTYPDFVELFHPGTAVADLSGWILERAGREDVHRFPAGSFIAPGGRTVLWLDPQGVDPASPPFGLPREGGTLFLRDASGRIVDTASWGRQIPDLALGRGMDGRWSLGIPSPGDANRPIPLAAASDLRLNEWLANPVPGAPDFVEIHNTSPDRPAAIGGFFLRVDRSVARIRPHSFVEPGGFALFHADEDPGPDHLDVRLPATGGRLSLRTGEDLPVDEVTYSSQAEGASGGRLPDGAETLAVFPDAATPGTGNFNPGNAPVRLQEILADPGATPAHGWIELHNPGPAPADLSGYRLRRAGAGVPDWRVPDGTDLPAGGHLVVTTGVGAPGARHTGWPLPATGTTVDLVGPGGILVDRVTFGFQLPGMSIGWGSDGWALRTQPTPGAANAAAVSTGPDDAVRINEWLATAPDRPDFIELYNPGSLPVNLAGLRLTDDPTLAGLEKHRIVPLSYIPARGFVVFVADADPAAGPDHLPFSISALGETLRLSTDRGFLYDGVTVLPAETGVAQGRLPDGGGDAVTLPRPTPGATNQPLTDSDGDGLPDFWEMQAGLDPADPSDATGDLDGDGFNNRQEFLAGTDPGDAEDHLGLRHAPSLAGQTLSFVAQPGRSYQVEASSDPRGPWEEVLRVEPGNERRQVEFLISPTAALPVRFFRVVTPSAR